LIAYLRNLLVLVSALLYVLVLLCSEVRKVLKLLSLLLPLTWASTKVVKVKVTDEHFEVEVEELKN